MFGPRYNVVTYSCAEQLKRLGYNIEPSWKPPSRVRGRILVAEIQQAVADHFAISLDEMLSDRRGRDVARPRQIAMYLCRMLTPKSMPDISRRFGNRDHTTVLHGVRQIERLRLVDGELDRAVRELTTKISTAEAV